MSYSLVQAVPCHFKKWHIIMKTIENKFMTAKAQMELPLGKRLGDSVYSAHSNHPQKATKIVADWWFSRMRFDFASETQISIRKVGV